MKSNPQLHTYATAAGVTAFSTTRHGGTGEGQYASFNINEYCGDTPEHTAECRKALAETLGVEESHIIMPHQTHGINPRIIGSEFLSLPQNIRQMLLEDVDSVLTDVPGICIGVSTADCVPVLLHDADHNAVAAVHAGWRGTVKNVVLRAVTEMRLAYGTDATKLTAIIGPAISMKNFEVGDEVYNEFLEANMPMDRIARREEKWHIDLPLCNKLQLMMAGLKEENIQMSGICTYDNAGDYFSARRLGKDSGRIFSGFVIR
jgi:polyphenol oxidase